MHRKLRYISKRNKLVQLVVQVKYHRAGTHTHTQTYQLRGQKQLQESACTV